MDKGVDSWWIAVDWVWITWAPVVDNRCEQAARTLSSSDNAASRCPQGVRTGGVDKWGDDRPPYSENLLLPGFPA
ncbi:hypothetical protein GCM10009682_10820 [Luedemannella flava]|uniref:Secreted protein n=1 Tax=Luedemannella flava TaxID=349316 RepID=A0ABP4XVH2_9ACTN